MAEEALAVPRGWPAWCFSKSLEAVQRLAMVLSGAAPLAVALVGGLSRHAREDAQPPPAA